MYHISSEPSARRQGLAHEALLLMMSYGKCTHKTGTLLYNMLCLAVGELGVRKFRAKILETNAASLQLFKKKLNFVEVIYQSGIRPKISDV